MLHRISLHVAAVSSIPTDEVAAKLFCNFWVGLFRDMLHNCVIVCDNPRDFASNILTAGNSWPMKYRKRLQELIATLVHRNRFVCAPVSSEPDSDCIDGDCGAFVADQGAFGEVIRITSQTCIECPNWTTISATAINLLDFSLSSLSHRIGRESVFVLHDNEWKQTDFENRILRPVLLHAKHVQVFDRYIGRSILKKVRNRQVVKFHDTYKRTILWMADIYSSGGNPTRGVFEVFCGINQQNLNATLKASIRAEVAKFETDVKNASGVQLKIILKDETNGGCCAHGRYLSTDQVSLIVDRGFDLLWDDALMIKSGLSPITDSRPVRDCAVAVCENCSSVSSQTRSLPAF